MTSRYVIALACASLVCVVSCGHAERAPEPKSVVVLMDASMSTANSPARDAYAQALETVMATLKPGDAFYAGWITDRSAGELSIPVRLEIPNPAPHAKNSVYKRAERKKLEAATCALVESARTLLAVELQKPHTGVNDTHIMTSLALAERVFSKLGRPRNVLVLLSDMLEDSDRLDFDEDNLAATARTKIISVERASGRLPVLTGAHVYVVGATAENDDRIFAVRDFWIEYFAATGAQLLREDYGPLIKFETDAPNECAK